VNESPGIAAAEPVSDTVLPSTAVWCAPASIETCTLDAVIVAVACLLPWPSVTVSATS